MKSLMSYAVVLAVLCLSSVYSKPIEKCETLEKNARNCLSESNCERNSECFEVAQIYLYCRVVPLYSFDEDLNQKLEQHTKECLGPVLNSVISQNLMLDTGKLSERPDTSDTILEEPVVPVDITSTSTEAGTSPSTEVVTGGSTEETTEYTGETTETNTDPPTTSEAQKYEDCQTYLEKARVCWQTEKFIADNCTLLAETEIKKCIEKEKKQYPCNIDGPKDVSSRLDTFIETTFGILCQLEESNKDCAVGGKLIDSEYLYMTIAHEDECKFLDFAIEMTQLKLGNLECQEVSTNYTKSIKDADFCKLPSPPTPEPTDGSNGLNANLTSIIMVALINAILVSKMFSKF